MGEIEVAFQVASLLIKGSGELAQLISRLSDHQRTLEQAEADRREAGARLDGPAEPTA
jgi:hypothetical protein